MGNQCMGADHHGHVPRMKGAIEALGYKREQLDVVIMQLVRLFRERGPAYVQADRAVRYPERVNG